MCGILFLHTHVHTHAHTHMGTGMVVHASNPSTWEVGEGESGVQGHVMTEVQSLVRIHSKFKVSLSSMRPCPKKKTNFFSLAVLDIIDNNIL